jgi:hypothetical protein
MKILVVGKQTVYPFQWTCNRCGTKYAVNEGDIRFITIFDSLDSEPSVVCIACGNVEYAPLTPISRKNWIEEHTKYKYFLGMTIGRTIK